MDDPVNEIESVIQALVSSTPSVQRQTIETYFTRDAAFTHPFCRTGSFDGSRYLVWGIYRWYKIMSPHIDLKVHSITYDQKSETLFVSISQVFRIFVVPFYSAPVSLVTVLGLYKDPFTQKYYLKSQEDLYQTSEFIKFVLPGIGSILVRLWQFIVSLMCLALAWIFAPVTWIEETTGFGSKTPLGQTSGLEHRTAHRSDDSSIIGRSTGPSKVPFESIGSSGDRGWLTTPVIEQR